MANWLLNSNVNMRCCLGKVLDELGAYCIGIVISPTKHHISFYVKPHLIEEFEKSPFFKRGALVKMTVTRNGAVWYKFDWRRLVVMLREEGLC